MLMELMGRLVRMRYGELCAWPTDEELKGLRRDYLETHLAEYRAHCIKVWRQGKREQAKEREKKRLIAAGEMLDPAEALKEIAASVKAGEIIRWADGRG